MEDNGALPARSPADGLLESTDGVPVDWSRVANSERLEEHARLDDLADSRTESMERGERERRDAGRKFLDHLAHPLTELQVARVEP